MSDPIGRIGHDTKFKRSGDGTSTGAMVKLARVKSIGALNFSRDLPDATTYDSPNRYEQVIAGIRRTGDVTIGLEFAADSDDYTHAVADYNSNSPGYYELEFPDGSKWGFSAYLRDIGVEPNLDDEMMAEFVYKITGQPSFTAAGA